LVELGGNMSIILALSDTHLTGPLIDGNYYPEPLRRLIEKADLMLHAGDFECQGAYDDLVGLCMDSKCELWAIEGNNPIHKAPQIHKAVQIRDFSRNEKGDPLPTQKADERFGLKIGLMHIANPSYDFSESAAADNAAEMILPSGAKGVDVLVFGHIHEPIIVWNKNTQGKRRLLVCPGPGSRGAIDRYHKCPSSPTVALLDIDGGNISRAEIIRIVWP
jgi:predicted phosphodiesterase